MSGTDYTWLELLFSNRFQWVRRLSGERWLKHREPGHSWIKVSGWFLSMTDKLGLSIEHYKKDKNYIFEDWRKCGNR